MADAQDDEDVGPDGIADLRERPNGEHEPNDSHNASCPGGSMIRRNARARVAQVEAVVSVPEGNERYNPDQKGEEANQKEKPTAPSLV
jgi:hypothetical protein